jgi:hypothetical protein
LNKKKCIFLFYKKCIFLFSISIFPKETHFFFEKFIAAKHCFAPPGQSLGGAKSLFSLHACQLPAGLCPGSWQLAAAGKNETAEQ